MRITDKSWVDKSEERAKVWCFFFKWLRSERVNNPLVGSGPRIRLSYLVVPNFSKSKQDNKVLQYAVKIKKY